LIAHGVEFLLVGAYALAFHGAPRFTGDLDVFVRPTLENASRVLAAVRAFGFPVAELRPDDLVDASRILQMGLEPVQIHVMSAISGVSWDDAWCDRAAGRCGRHEVPFLGRDSFLRNKRAAGRPKDLADIDAITPGEDERSS
jgi:protein gp37